MSDNWQMFLRPDEAGDLYIIANVGISEEIDSLAPPTLVRIDLPVKSADGYPDEAEDDALHVIEDHLNPLLEEQGSLYVGRITRPGMRSLFHYAPFGEDVLEKILAEVEAQFGVRPGSYVGADPEHRVYKSMLYPTAEEWSVLQDVGVFMQLDENGDARDVARPVRHWAYFPQQAAADAFARHIESAGYDLEEVGAMPDGKPDSRFCVRFTKTDAPSYGPFTQANIALREAAQRCGGHYDGWETEIVRKLQ